MLIINRKGSFLTQETMSCFNAVSLIIKSFRASKMFYLFNSHSYPQMSSAFCTSAITGNCSSRKTVGNHSRDRSIAHQARGGVNSNGRSEHFAINASHQQCW